MRYDKIIKIYNNDGPGLLREQFESSNYDRIKDKIVLIIPSHAVVGLLLYHSDNYNKSGVEVIDSLVVAKEYHEILTYAFYNWGNHFGLLENTQELMKKLKAKGYHLYMLSNCSVMFDIYHKQYEVFELLEEKYVSAHRKLTKPSKEIYLDFLNLYQLKADECLFIDDVEANVLGARSVGMQAYHFTGDINELEEILL